mgnify:CR=1 FL=1
MLTAPVLTLEDGVAIGTGGAELTVDGDVLTGERFALDLDTAVVVVDNGVWSREEEGTLTFEGLQVTRGNRVIEYEGCAEALVGLYVTPEKAPAGHPLICGDRCGVIIGLCDVPDDFADEEDDVCP